MVWAVFAVLTALAALAVLVPLARGRRPAAEAEGGVAVYADQLAEVDRDLARGVIGEVEAAAARTEIGRRLLRASHAGAPAAPPRGWRGRLVAAVAIVAVPVATVALYVALGAPTTPDEPLAARRAAPADGQSVEALVARVEAHLADNPDDGQGWAVLGPVYLRVGRAGDAAAAYRNAIRLAGPTASLEAGLGEALTMVAGGVVTAEARAAFAEAARLDPAALRPRFYLALALTQEGRRDAAIAAWRALLAEAQGGEPWVAAVKRELAGLGAPAVAPAAPGDAPAAGQGAAPGPSAADMEGGAAPRAADMEAMAALPAAERAKIIENMVAGLAERLSRDGGSLDEWVRLARAYGVLGKRDDARAALVRAKAAFPEPAAQQRIDETAAALDLTL